MGSDETAARRAEPIAVIGMACRFPGAPDIPSLWRLLEAGGNAVTEGVPGSGVGRVGELLPETAAGNSACRFGAFVPDIDLFDNGFFRISPVEAELLDPQQRMMLEVSWQALEDAGIDPDRLKGSRTGVYAGISNDEYRMLVVEGEKPAEAAGCLYALSGTNLNGAAGRVSFVLGVMGPAKAVDAACASSLVSVHDAVADLQAGKADLALAGGVQAILNGRIYELRADSMMLSPDGQCKAFDASANGYVRGEGCGVVVLKRLREAEADGDPIWGVIHGAAVNHGGASVGLTVPHEPALVRVMNEALSDAGVSPAAVDYIEAHGTGTTVGDPIEINAVAAAYASEREAEHPLLVGSVKTNLGHLESAAGIAGLIKAVLVVQQGVIPKHLHFRDPNPSLDWERLPIRVTSEMSDWPGRDSRPRLAGVNSFGISGTNSHLIVGEYRDGDQPRARRRLEGSTRPVTVGEARPSGGGVRDRGTRVLPISGKNPGALRELTGRYLEWLEAGDGDSGERRLPDLAWTAGVGRSHFDHRAALVFSDAASLREQLRALADAGDGVEPGGRAKVAFAYTGQGSQWAGMGEALYECEPVVRSVLDRCEAAFREARGTSLLDVMFGRGGGDADLGDTAWEQPALYALECALTALWASVGIRPDVVMGHSVGEIAAARTAGVFSLETGMRFAAARGTLLSGTAPGAMAAAFAPAERVAAAVEAWNATSSGLPVNISADNGAHQVVSGPTTGIEGVSKRLEDDGIRVRRLNTTRAFHSALVEPALPELQAVLDDGEIGSPAVTLVSNLTGRPVAPGEALDGAYWRRHAREPVAFAQGVGALAELGVDLVVEIGPRPVLAPMVMSAWPAAAAANAPAVIASQRAPSGDETAEGHAHFVKGVAEVYEAGLPVRFEGLFTGESRRRLSLPGYPFQRERYWLKAPKRRRQGAGHPLLGVRHESARGEITFETEVFPSDPAWLNDHRVFERRIAPGALSGAMAVAASLAEGGGPVALEDMQLHNPLVFPEDKTEGEADEGGRKLQVALDAPEPASPRRVQVFSKGPEGEWTLHLEGRVSPDAGVPENGGRADLEGLKAGLTPGDVGAYYRARSATGIDLGPSFRTLERVWSRPGEAVAEVSFPEALGRNELEIHPLVLDGCFQTVGVARLAGGADEATYLPFGWDRVWLSGRLPDRVVCHVRMNEPAPDSGTQGAEPAEVLSGEIRIYDPAGAPLGGLSGYAVKRATREALLSAVEGVDELLYEIVWRDRALPPGITAADFLPAPAEVAADSRLLAEYLTAESVGPRDRNALLADLERWSRSRALATLEELGFRRDAGATVDPEVLREELNVLPEHRRLFRRLLEMLAKSGVLAEAGDGFTVTVGSGDPLPEHLPRDLDAFADRMVERYPHGVTEVGLFRRCGGALGQALRGEADPLTLLFSSGDPTPADLYLKAPVARAANKMLRDAVRALLARLPEGRRLRVIEVGAGTGSATTFVLPELPEGRFTYTYTDISAGFFAEAESRFGDGGGCIEYRPLDVEKEPIGQGFERHGYDLLIASNVLHATRVPPGDAGTLPGPPRPLGGAGRPREPERARLDGPDLRAARRLVAVRRRLPPAPRPGEPRGMAAGARRCRLHRRGSPGSGRVGRGRDPGQGRDRGPGTSGREGTARPLDPDRRPRRPRDRTGGRPGGAQPDGGAGERGGARGRCSGPAGPRRLRRRGGTGTARVVGIAHREPARRHAVQRRGPPRFPGRPRTIGHHRGGRGGRAPGDGERAGAHPGGGRCRPDAREGNVVPHPGRPGAGTGELRGARRRDALGLRQGGGPGGAAPAGADAGSRSGAAGPRAGPPERTALSRRGEPHRLPARRPPGGAPGPGGRRGRAPHAARGSRVGARAGPRGRLRKALRQAAAGAPARTAGGAGRRRSRRAQLLGRVPLARLHPGGEPRPGDVRPHPRGRFRGLPGLRG